METTQFTKLSIKKNDQVQVMTGRDKGKIGKVLNVNHKTGRVTVEKINLVKRHMRKNQKNPQGGIVEKETPIHYSNIQLFCPKCNRGVRHARKIVEKSAAKKGAKSTKAPSSAKKTMKVRVCKRCDETLDVAKA